MGNSFSLPNVKVFYPTDHVMYQLSNHVTSLKTKQGYPFILRMLQIMAIIQHYVRTVDGDIVVLVVCFISTFRLSELWRVSEVGKAPQYSHPRYLLLSWPFQTSDINHFPCHQMVRHNITLPRMWQEDCLGNTPRLTDTMNHPASPLGILTCRSLNDLRLSCVVRGVVWQRSMNQSPSFTSGKRFWRTYHTLKQLCWNM